MAIAEVAIKPKACTKSGNLYSRCNLPPDRVQPGSPLRAVCNSASVSFGIPHVSEARGEEVTLKRSHALRVPPMRPVLLQTHLPGVELRARGKVRDVYNAGGDL